MDINQARLLAAGYRHVLTVGAMNSVGTQIDGIGPVCFVCEMERSGILPEFARYRDRYVCGFGFVGFFGVSESEASTITNGTYKTGHECAAIVKSLLSKYGYELDDNGYIIERNWAQEQYQKAINGPKLVEVVAA